MGRLDQKIEDPEHSLENDLSQSIEELQQLLRLLEQATLEVTDSQTKLKLSLENFSKTLIKIPN